MLSLLGSSRQKCEQCNGDEIPGAWGREGEGQRPWQRSMPLAALRKVHLQVSSLGDALRPQRAPVFLDGLSHRIL